MPVQNGGKPIVLTASRSEISRYSGDPFAAFMATFPNKWVPKILLNEEWFEAENLKDGQARFVPYGLRKIETILKDQFGEENIATVHPEKLHEFVGPNTKVVGVTSMDPMGLAYVSITYNSMIGIGGASVDEVEFRRVMENPALKKYHPRIIVGGSGAWQVRDAGKVEEYGIDTLVHAESELIVADLFRKALNGEALPREVEGSHVPLEKIPQISRAASYGVVEITRGCGRGCHFCSPTTKSRHSVPIDFIMKEVEINIKGGSNSIFTATEDMFIYKCGPKFVPNREAVVELYKSIADYPGVRYIHLSHASVAPVVHDPKLVEELTPILMPKTKYVKGFRSYTKDFVTVLFGIETGSIRLMEKYMKGKALPYHVKDWHEIVTQGVGIFNDYGWRPMCTIITGWPDENEDDTLQSLELLDKLKGSEMFYVPLLFIPLEDSKLRDEKIMPLDYMSEAQWDIMSTCWKENINVWDPGKQPLFSIAAMFSYFLFYRWKHGPKAFRPLMKIAGFPDSFLGKMDRSCDPKYCQPV
ncbi:MAG: B12-binding domain-containing radical SAM protein [Methanobacteriota archaeon]|nr:MAG: B12-binding domain-containing radical SAM protein [Euryarchaeota archaeon]